MATITHSPRLGTTGPAVGQWSRYTNIAAGVWLFISAFVFERPEASQTNAWLVGVAIAVCAAWALRESAVRYLNTALAIWLFIAATALFRAPGPPMANDIIVAIVVFAVSLVPSSSAGGRDILTPSSGTR